MLIRFRDGGSFTNPFSVLDDFMSRDLTSFFGRDVSELLQRNQGIAIPAVNIRETEHSFQIELAAPGLRKEDFCINLEHDMLTISAQQETRTEEGPADQGQLQGQFTTNGAIAGGSAEGDGATSAQPEAAAGGGSGQLAAQGSSSPAMQSRAASQPQRYTRREFSYSAFTRSFALPETVDPEKISGSYENGILTVTVPKREQQARLSRTIGIS